MIGIITSIITLGTVVGGYFMVKDVGKDVATGAENTANYITALLPYVVIILVLIVFMKYGLPYLTRRSGNGGNRERKEKYRNKRR